MSRHSDLFGGVIVLFFTGGIQSYPPETTLYTYPANATLLTSSEENKVYFKELEDAVHKFTLPGTVAEVLANYTVIDTQGMQERIGYVKEFIRNRKKKWYNNHTGRFETYFQRMAKVHEGIMDELFDHPMQDKDYKRERYMNNALIERYLAHHPNVSFIPEMHAVTDYDVEYSGDRVVDDYEVKRRKRAVDETKTHVSKIHSKKAMNSGKISNIVQDGKDDVNKNKLEVSVLDTNSNNKHVKFNKEEVNKYRAKDELFRSGIVKPKEEILIKYKRKHRKRREIGDQHYVSNKDLLKALKYQALKNQFVESVEIKHVVKRNADDDDSVPARKKELYKDYKSDWPYSKYDSKIHCDYFVRIPKRKKNSSDFKKLHTPESSIFNSFYNDGEYDRDLEKVKKKNLYRSMEYWTFTDPMAKYTSTSTKKYDKPYPTFGRNAATISVGASRFKLFNRNWYNEYKHRVHKRDVFGSNSTAVKMVHKIGNYVSKVGLVYNTLMTFYFKSLYRYLRNMYYQSYFSSYPQVIQLNDDPDYMDAVNRMANWSNNMFTTINPNLTFTILSQGNETQTQYVVLDWYTEKYMDNSTQYFCDYLNDTYMLVNNRLKLYNKTIHQLMPSPDENQNGSSETDYTMFDTRTVEPPMLTWVGSAEKKQLNLNSSNSYNNDKYLVLKNMSNPLDSYQASLNDIMGRKKIHTMYLNTNNTNKENTSSLINESNKESNLVKINAKNGESFLNDGTSFTTANQSVLLGATDYQDDFFDNAADFVLSFFLKNTTRKLNTETTTDDYTEITNDLFDKIGNAAKGFFNMCNNANISSGSVEATSDISTSTVNTIMKNSSGERTLKNENFSTFPYKNMFTNETMRNETKQKLLRRTGGVKLSNYSFKSIPKRNMSSSISSTNWRKIRSKRSLAYRCLKGIKFVGRVFSPIEKHIVNVLDDIFGPYSSSNGKSHKATELKHSFSKTSKIARSSENDLHNHEKHLSSSLEEEKSGARGGPISGKSATGKDNSKLETHIDESNRWKENSLREKTAISLESKENSDSRITTRKSKKKKKHRKKHKDMDRFFDDATTQKSDTPNESNEIRSVKNIDDPILPNFIKHPEFGDEDMDNTIDISNKSLGLKASKNEENPSPSNPPFGDQMGYSKFPDYNVQQNPYDKNQQFGNQMDNNTFQNYDQQNPYGRNQPFGNQIGNNTFQDYDQQNPYGRNEQFGNQMAHNTLQDYDQNPYRKNQPYYGNQMGNNTFQDYDQQNPYGRNQAFGNQIGNTRNRFQDYDQQNPYGRNQPFGDQLGNNTFQDYDQKKPYGINQPFGNQIQNNTIQDYDQQDPYGRNEPFGNQIGNNTLQDYDQQNIYGRNEQFGNQMAHNTLQDYEQQNPYGKNQPFGNQMGNNTFQDYDQQNPYEKNQPFGNQMGNNTFQDYDQQNPYEKNQPFNQSNGLNPYNNYGDIHNPQLSGNSGFPSNANGPVQDPNSMSPPFNVGAGEVLNNDPNTVMQNNSVDHSSFSNQVSPQPEVGAQGNMRSNNVLMNQNPLQGRQQLF